MAELGLGVPELVFYLWIIVCRFACQQAPTGAMIKLRRIRL